MPDGTGFFTRITSWFKDDDPEPPPEAPVDGDFGEGPIDVGPEAEPTFGTYQPDLSPGFAQADLTNSLDVDLTPRITLPDDPGDTLDDTVHDDTVVQDDATNDVAEVESPPPPPDLTNAFDAHADEASNPDLVGELGDLDLEIRPGPPLPDPEPTYEFDLGPDPLADLPTEVPIAPPEVGDPTMDTGMETGMDDGLDDLA